MSLSSDKLSWNFFTPSSQTPHSSPWPLLPHRSQPLLPLSYLTWLSAAAARETLKQNSSHNWTQCAPKHSLHFLVVTSKHVVEHMVRWNHCGLMSLISKVSVLWETVDLPSQNTGGSRARDHWENCGGPCASLLPWAVFSPDGSARGWWRCLFWSSVTGGFFSPAVS